MKKSLLLVAAMIMGSSVAMASRARVTALGAHSVSRSTDVNNIFTNPAKTAELPNAVVAEWGNTTAGSATKAQGGFVRAMGDARMAFYLGGENANLESYLGTTGSGLTAKQNNPFNVFYASKGSDMSWGLGFSYLSVDKKATLQKLSAMGLSFGAATSDWEAYVHADLSSSGENGASNKKYTGNAGLTFGGQYNMSDMIVYLEYMMNGGKYDNAGTESKVDHTRYHLGVESFVKGTGSHFFYGVKYAADTQKSASATISETTMLPVYAGVEADVASWMTARVSLSQNVLIDSSKSGTDTETSATNSTTVAAGAGLKFGALTIDGTFEGTGAAGNGDLDGVNLLSKVGMTYAY